MLGYVGRSRKEYGRFIEEGLQRGYASPWEDLKGQVILGEEGFWERVKGKWMKGKGSAKEQPSLRALEAKGPEEILRKVAGYFRLKAEGLRKRRSGYRDQRGLVMEMMYRYSGVHQKEIARYMGEIDYTTVSHERRRLRERMEEDSKLKRWHKDIELLFVS